MTIVAKGMGKLKHGEHVHYLNSFQTPPKAGVRIAVIFDDDVRAEALVITVVDDGNTMEIMLHERSWNLHKTDTHDRWKVG